MQSITGNILHCGDRVVQKNKMSLEIEKPAETSDGVFIILIIIIFNILASYIKQWKYFARLEKITQKRLKKVNK